MKKFEDYSEEHVNFYEPGIVPILLKKGIKLAKNKKIIFADVGCGDANLLNQILNNGLLKREELLGIEPSDIRRERSSEGIKIVKGTAEKIPFKANHFHMIMSNQVIEHLKEDRPMLKEVRRVLKKDGIFYVSSVVKKPWGVWIYWKDGGFVSDPTHYREYKSKEEFEKLISSEGFEVLDTKIELFKHSIIDMFIRLLIKIKLVNPKKVVRIYQNHSFLFKLRNAFRWPMFGFYNVEVLARKTN